MASILSALPSKEDMLKVSNIPEACKIFKILPEVWQQVSTQLGEENFDELEELAQILPQDFEKSVETAVGKNPIKRTRLAMLFNSVQVRFDGKIFSFFTTKAEPTEQVTTTVLATASSTTEQKEKPYEPKVALAQVWDQALSQEIPLMKTADIMVRRTRYFNWQGDWPLDDERVSDNQTTALAWVAANDLNVLAVDFSVWAKHHNQHKHMS